MPTWKIEEIYSSPDQYAFAYVLSLLSISKQIGTWKIVEISTPVLINAHLFLAIFHDQCEHGLLTHHHFDEYVHCQVSH